MKKILLFLSLTVLMFVGLFALTSCGMLLAKVGLYKDIEYRVDENHKITITGYTGEKNKLEIPAWIDGYKVIGIEFDAADSSLDVIEKIKIPKTITELSPDTFLPCKNLKEITVAIDNPKYKYFHGALYTKDGKTLICYPQAREDAELVVHKRVTKIDDRAFLNARCLKSVTLSGTVEIGNFAFSGCTGLEKINLGENGKLTSIGKSAFENCVSLTSLHIPNGVELLGPSLFVGCDALASVTFDEPSYWKSDGEEISTDILSDPAAAVEFLKDFDKAITQDIPETLPDTDPGTNPDTDSGTNPDTNPDTDPDTNPDTEPDIDPDTEPTE